MEGRYASVKRDWFEATGTARVRMPSGSIELSFHRQNLRIERLKKIRIF